MGVRGRTSTLFAVLFLLPNRFCAAIGGVASAGAQGDAEPPRGPMQVVVGAGARRDCAPR
jgi:hypothetical protein